MFITTHHISHYYPGAELAALHDISLTISSGWTGVVGANGAGKSTLLKIMCGTLLPDQGSVSSPCKGIYCGQSTDISSSVLEDFAYDYRAEAIELRDLLCIDSAWLWRFDSLSYGEKKRVQIACALVNNPAILALDEPTNHLDASTRALVAKTLSKYRGIGLLVSHDRELLDELIDTCIFMESGKATVFSGTYTQAKKELELRRKTAVHDRQEARRELLKTQAESTRRAETAARAASRRSARHLDRHDNDARSKIKLAIYSGQDGKTGKLSSQMDKKVERAQRRLENAQVKKLYNGSLTLDTKPSTRKVLATLPQSTLSLGEERVLSHPTLFVGNTDHIGLWGRNGTGKSTLVKNLLDQVHAKESIVYVPQEVSTQQSKELLAEIKLLDSDMRGKMLSIVARLNSPPARLLEGGETSPGEMRKLMLAKGLLLSPTLIVLDEPTNHMDIHSIEALQAVLKDCQCALILVSHDRQFLDELTSIRWVFEAEERDVNLLGNVTVKVVW